MRPARLASIAVAAVLLAAAAAALPPEGERGLPLIHTYTAASVAGGAESQNFDIAVDDQGYVYLANLGGVVVYDGAWWRVVPVGRDETAFTLAIDRTGRVAAGGVDEFGYIAADEGGQLKFHSLLASLPPADRRFGQVLAVVPFGDGFIFATEHSILRWDGTRITKIRSLPGKPPYARVFPVDDAVYLWLPGEGLRLLGEDGIASVPGGDQFASRRIDLMLPGAGGTKLISIRGEGLTLLQADGTAAPFAAEASEWLAPRKALCGRLLADGRWVIGTVLGGILVLGADGTVEETIHAGRGLPDDFVAGIDTDRDGSLWVAMNTGLARLEITSPISVIDSRRGLRGSVYSLSRHRGELWAGTSAGVFRGNRSGGTWERVDAVSTSAWSFASRGEELIVGTGNGVYVVDARGEAKMIGGTDGVIAYVLESSTNHPDRIWVGHDSGLLALERRAGTWTVAGELHDDPVLVRTVTELPDGTLWCGTARGLVRVTEAADLEKARAETFHDGEIYVARIRGELLATRDGAPHRLDARTGALTPLAGIQHFRRADALSVLTADSRGNLWMNTRPPQVALWREGRWVESRTLRALPMSCETIYAEADGVVWIGTDDGLFRHAGGIDEPAPPLPAPHIARIAADDTDVLFGGAPRSRPESATIAAGVRRLRIDLAPLAHRAGLAFQTRLEPVDEQWSAPLPQPYTELTRLPPGRYVFRVRSVGMNGEYSPESEWSFTLPPPWYRTWWAYSAAALLLFLLVIAYGRYRSRAARVVATRLEERVAEQTRELQRTVEELRRVQSHLESANQRLEDISLQDDLTGIANRRRLEQALFDEWSRARRHRTSVAFILFDLDSFKTLNDTYGHREGDECLRSIGRYLAERAGRAGDVVARYGGEEFALLLPNTDLPGAIDVAERLRSGVEALTKHHDASERRITASFGVAATIPATDSDYPQLVEAADRALYCAKRAGRNCVRTEPVDGGAGPRAVPHLRRV